MERRSFPFFFFLLLTLFATHFYLENRERNRIEEWKKQYENQKPASRETGSLETGAPLASSAKESPAKEGISSKKEWHDEELYVLETPWQQLVFSNYGGALAEINLPFHSATHKDSVVRSIGFDADMEEEYPRNAVFPLSPYHLSDEKESESKTGDQSDNKEGLRKGTFGGYHPLIRRNLLKNDHYEHRLDPRFYALNIIGENPEISQIKYKVTHFDSHSITFEALHGMRKIIKKYNLSATDLESAPYCLDLTVEITGDSKGLWLSSGIPEVEQISGSTTSSLKYRMTKGKNRQVDPIELPEKVSSFNLIRPDWVSNSNGFFTIIVDPLSKLANGMRVLKVAGKDAPSRLSLLDPVTFPENDLPGYETLLPLEEGISEFRIFAGPLSSSVLKQVDQTFTDAKVGYDPDYRSSQTYNGWFTWISEPFAKLLFFIMRGFHFITGSWGISIILLTITIRTFFYPLKVWSTKSMVKLQAVGPEIEAMRARYKNDKARIQAETLRIYQEKGANPISGCLPLLIQFPFLIWMYDLLKSTFELRGACFIPGWITDLAAPDIFIELPFRLPFFGQNLHLLPFIMAAVLYLSQGVFAQTQPTDPNSEQARQQKAMRTFSSLLFSVFFYNMPSGLNIYMIASTLTDSFQQWWIVKKMQKTSNRVR